MHNTRRIVVGADCLQIARPSAAGVGTSIPLLPCIRVFKVLFASIVTVKRPEFGANVPFLSSRAKDGSMQLWLSGPRAFFLPK